MRNSLYQQVFLGALAKLLLGAKERNDENLTLNEFGFRFSTELRLRLLPLVLMRGREKLEPGDLTGAKLPKAGLPTRSPRTEAFHSCEP